MEVLLEQGSQEWLDFRRSRRMASETPAVMGLSPYQKPHDIRKVKQGGAGGFVNNAMREGTRLEPVVREAYSQRYESMRPAVLVEGDYGASLDGINMDQNGIFECKVPSNGRESDRWDAALKGELLPYDYAQVQHQLMVSKADWCHFCVWDKESEDFALVHVSPDPEFWVKICHAWDAFWDDLGLREDRKWVEAVLDYREAKEGADVAQAILDQKKAALIELLQGDSNEGAGVRVQRIKVKGNVDWKKVQSHYSLADATLDTFRKPDSEQIRINELKE